MLGEEIFLFTIIAIMIHACSQVFKGNVERSIVSSISALIYLTCMWVPAQLQEAGLLLGKVSTLITAGQITSDEIGRLSWYWSLELGIIFLGERFCQLFAGNASSSSSKAVSDRGRDMLISIILVSIGVVALFLIPANSAEDRAVAGQGAATILRLFFTVGLAFIAFHRCFRRLEFVCILAAGILILVSTQVRSPIIVVMIAYVAGVISRKELNPKRLLLFICIAVCFAMLASIMSSVRGSLIRGEGVDASRILSAAFDQPYLSVYQSGIDTLDGYRLSAAIQPYEPARPLSILTMVTTFIPRFIWPDKPTELSVEISQKYLSYGAGGQFLSPVGYLHLAFGYYFFALVGLFAFALTSSYAILKLKQSFLLTVVILIVFRFMMGGAPFDIYYGLTHVIPYFLARQIAAWIGKPQYKAAMTARKPLHRK